MRLLVLTTSYPTADNPGGGIFIRRMLEHLPDHVRITVVTPDTQEATRRSGSGSSNHILRIIPVRYAPKKLQVLANRPGGIPAAMTSAPWLTILAPIWALMMFFKTLRLAGKSDLIHAHWSVCGLIGGLAGRLTGTPVITTFHGTDVKWAERSDLFRLIIRSCFQLNVRIVTVSSAMADRLRSEWPRWRHKILSIPNGVSHDFFNSNTERRAVEGPGLVFCTVGNLIESKQVNHIIRAFGCVVARGRAARLVIAGDGPRGPWLRQLATRLGLDRQVDFLGAIPPDQVPELMTRTHVLVLASAHEGLPTIVLEAMAAGVAVIASDINGVRELIEHERTGLLFSSGDIEGLGARMTALVDRPDLARKLAGRARRWIADQDPSWRNTAGQYMRIYRRAIDKVLP